LFDYNGEINKYVKEKMFKKISKWFLSLESDYDRKWKHKKLMAKNPGLAEKELGTRQSLGMPIK
jgi:hypothetical protein